MVESVRRSYLSIDARTLGLLRIAIAVTLLFDLMKRACVLSVFYTNHSLIPNHTLLWRPLKEFTFSFLFAFSTKQEVRCAFLLIALVYGCLLIGYRARVAHFLSWLCLTSLHARVEFLSYGGDYVLSDLVLWTAFLPTDRRFSVDALRGRTSDQPVHSLAALAVIVQLAVIYLFNVVSKHGPTWQDGTAVYWVLHQERIVTWLGWQAREHLPLWFFQSLSYSAIAMEAALPLLILSPWGRPWTRRAAILLIWALHGGMALSINLGVFSPVMMLYALVLIDAREWDLLERWWARRENLRARVEPYLYKWRALWRNEGAALTPRRSWLRWVRESCVVVLLLAACSQTLNENGDVPELLHHPQPRWLRGVIGYFRLNQGWSMFAPDAPLEDEWIVVDARTADGRHVDPYNELASRVADPSLRAIPERLGQDAAYCDFIQHVIGNGLLHGPFRDWIMAYHRRTHRAGDRIAAFDAYVIRQRSPAPGEPKPTDITAEVFLSHGANRELAAISGAQ